jgi:hypothetical protein
MVSFYDGGEDREAVFGVQGRIKIVAVDARNLLFVQVSGGNPGVESILQSPRPAWPSRSNPTIK